MAINKEQIRDLLGSGLSNEVVATAVGCTPAYISQLMSDSSFSDSVITLRTATLQASNDRDKMLDAVEDCLIAKFADHVESGAIYKPADILRSLQVINSAKRRGVPAHQSIVIQNKIVNLTIPTEVVRNFTQNKDGEVIEVEGETLVTMPAHTLLRELAAKRTNGDNYEKAARYLPSANSGNSANESSSTDPPAENRHGGRERFFAKQGTGGKTQGF